MPVSKKYLLELNLGEYRKFMIGLPKRVEDLPLGLQNNEAKEFFTLWIKIIQKKENIEQLLREDARNKDKILQELTSGSFYNDLLKHIGEIMQYQIKTVTGQTTTKEIEDKN